MLGKLGIFMFCLKVGGLYKLHVIKLIITNILVGRDFVRAELEKNIFYKTFMNTILGKVNVFVISTPANLENDTHNVYSNKTFIPYFQPHLLSYFSDKLKALLAQRYSRPFHYVVTQCTASLHRPMLQYTVSLCRYTVHRFTALPNATVHRLVGEQPDKQC